jgi:prepilin-type processing-associated H-X9-DG protein
MTMYTQQYGVFATASPGAANLNGSHVAAWPTLLRKLLGGNQKVFYCPAQDPKCEWKADAPGMVLYADEYHTKFGYEIGERLLINCLTWDAQEAKRGTPFSYGCNVHGASVLSYPPTGRGMGQFTGAGELRSRQVTSVKSSAEFMIMADTTAEGFCDFEVESFEDAQFVNNVPRSPLLTIVPAKIHRGGANILFCDGHVQWSLQRDLICKSPYVPEESAKQRLWNADNLPASNWP